MLRLLLALLPALVCMSKNEVKVVRSASTTLLQNLFDGYDKRIRPFADNFTAVTVHTTVVLGILIEVENEQVAAYVISHVQRWRDPRLTWDPRRYENVRELIVPQSALWLPRLFVYNSMNTHNLLEDDKYDVRLRHDGFIKINIPQYVKCICRLSIEDFPFDTQFCAVALASPLLTVHEMDVISNAPPVDSYFAGNAEWNLTKVTVRHLHFQEEGENRSEVHFIFHLRRRPVFYIIVIVVPIFLISMLSIMGIFTPGSNEAPRSEKVSLGLGSLLAMTVLLGIIADAMPKSNSIPLLGYYILAVILLCTVAVWVSTTMATIGRKMVSRREMPSHSAYKMAMIRPRLSSFVPFTSRSSIAVSSRSTCPYGNFGGGSAAGPMTSGRRSSAATMDVPCSPILKKRCGSFRDRTAEKIRNYISFEKPCSDDERRFNNFPMSGNSNNMNRNNNGEVGKQRKKSLANGSILSAAGGCGTHGLPRRCASAGHHDALASCGSSIDTPGQSQAQWREFDANIFEEFSENLGKIQELLSILTDSQRFINRNVTKGRHRELIEREWKRVFYRIEYFFLVLFEILNLGALLIFLRNAWNEEPRIREPLV